ncbi:ExbD/TolR family protein [Cellulophaga omnivescoria]|uniref:ExbD/TolR family protein n=1 Tax=Cellulophaga omnivescoria TaxID=1888890 RepID=UPI00098757B8|nr:biopolymer transporter ExbD [Cellulophaga omnivescoria]WBU88021.1 biopolymer transporter ExbD [Cellulophaga omnivescoria]WKB80001.1 biopolymer transporter ExbD [Cellulophaga lytica]
MSKFKKKKDGELPPVSTASLPDIVFMLLFFFMTVTVMKDSEPLVANELPNASEIKKLEKKDRVVYIFVGQPTEKYQSAFGKEPKIQLNDKFANVSEVGDYVLEEIAKKPQEVQSSITTALKIDKNANMGIVMDIKEELRKVNALKVNYTTYEGDAFKNLQ